jgi:cellulose synthase/poly-beta-1,6-N-acetylglucosamine synthase-like glycosyltransferase
MRISMYVSSLFSYTLLYKNTKKDSLDSYPPVSIIKPLAGPDVNLKVNLETYFNLKYPKYEILFCTQSEDDPSLRTVKELMEEYPNVDVQVFASELYVHTYILYITLACWPTCVFTLAKNLSVF